MIFRPSGGSALKTGMILPWKPRPGLRITSTVCEHSSLWHPQGQVKALQCKEEAISMIYRLPLKEEIMLHGCVDAIKFKMSYFSWINYFSWNSDISFLNSLVNIILVQTLNCKWLKSIFYLHFAPIFFLLEIWVIFGCFYVSFCEIEYINSICPVFCWQSERFCYKPT